MLANVGQVKKQRLRGNQQTYPQLNWRNFLDEIQIVQQIEQFDVPIEGRPRRERDEGWRQRDSCLPAQRDDIDEILAGVSLPQFPKHLVVYGFHGTRDEQAS